MSEGAGTWRFPRAFWTANTVELFERMAYYGTFIALRTYLLRVVGLDDVSAGIIAGLFAGLIYLFPFFTGAIADRIGFRYSLILAFALLTTGYGMLGMFNMLSPVLLGLFLIVVGGAFVKPIITGTVSKSSDETNRARAFSLFYMVVNIGAFIGKTAVKDIRQDLGVANVPYFSAAAAAIALVLVILFYWPKAQEDTRPHNLHDSVLGMIGAISNFRFLALILITAGFWTIQGQLYASMPDYVLRLVGEGAAPEWYANINPLVVVICVVPVTHMIRKWKPEIAISVALALVPFSALSMSLSHLFGSDINFFGYMVHPITMMMVIGISLQGFSECFLSPKYLEYASKQAPKGQEGMYLGYAHLNTFFAWIFGFIFAGYLLKWFCPDPTTLSIAEQAQREAAIAGVGQMPEAYASAHYLWYAFAGVGFISFLALLVYIRITKKLDARKG